MSTITTIASTDHPKDSRAVINTNFSNLNTDKLETLSNVGTGAGTIAKTKSGTDTPLKTIKAGSANITVTNNTNDITIDVASTVSDASTTVKGIIEVSVAPVSPTIPIAVGDNDPRVPTQNENDALLGTSGTAVSTSNKLVDAGDVSSAGASGKIVRATGTALPALSAANLTNLPSSSFVSSLATVSSSTTQNIDTTVTCGFVPKVITLYYRMQGSPSGGANEFSAGTALYDASGTLIGNLGAYTNVPTATTLNGTSSSFNTTGPTVGDSTGSGAKVTLSITSVTATSFVVRGTFLGGLGNTATAIFTAVVTS